MRTFGTRRERPCPCDSRQINSQWLMTFLVDFCPPCRVLSVHANKTGRSKRCQTACMIPSFSMALDGISLGFVLGRPHTRRRHFSYKLIVSSGWWMVNWSRMKLAWSPINSPWVLKHLTLFDWVTTQSEELRPGYIVRKIVWLVCRFASSTFSLAARSWRRSVCVCVWRRRDGRAGDGRA